MEESMSPIFSHCWTPYSVKNNACEAIASQHAGEYSKKVSGRVLFSCSPTSYDETTIRRAKVRLFLVQKERCITTISDQLTAYMSLFVGRKDDYAVQLPDGRYRRVGKPLEASDVFDHLMGTRSYGTYVTDERGCCRFAVFDADNQQGLDYLWNLHE